jgi:8-oxo-dGTP pyrophosphatase MutT (NUDIX family)
LKNPWEKLSSRVVYENDWFLLREDRVVTPSGSEGLYSFVEVNPVAAVLPLTADLSIYLVGQYRYPLDMYSWEIPEGSTKNGESLEECARRELLEETGLSAKKWTRLGSFHTGNSLTNEVGHIYLAEDLSQGTAKPDHTEKLEIKKIPFMESYKMVLKGEIKDALTVIGIYRAYYDLHQAGRLR